MVKLEEQNCGNCAHQTVGICWNKNSFYGEETKLDEWCWCWEKPPKR